VLKDLKNKIPF